MFIRDRLTATTRIPSPPATTGLDYDSLRPSVSYDGRYVAFQYGTTSTQPGREEDVWVYDRMTGQNSEVSVNALGVSSDRDAERAAISGDGQTVLFTTSATNLVPGVTGNTFRQVFMAKPDVVAVTVNVAAPVPQTLRVDSFMPTATGFIATFTQPLETTAAQSVRLRQRWADAS